MKRTDYPKNWKRIRAEIMDRAKQYGDDGGSRCECHGECGGDHDEDGNCYQCPRRHGHYLAEYDEKYRGKDRLVVLTVAHLNHNRRDNRRSNLKALCQRCHLRLDRHQHAHTAAATRDRKAGQARLFELDR